MLTGRELGHAFSACRAVGHSTCIAQTWKASSGKLHSGICLMALADCSAAGISPCASYSTLMHTYMSALKLVTLCRQEGYFHYLFGVEDEDYYGALDLRDGRTMLFMPRLPEAYAVNNLQLPMRLRYAIFSQLRSMKQPLTDHRCMT